MTNPVGEEVPLAPRLMEWAQPGQKREVRMKEEAECKDQRLRDMCRCVEMWMCGVEVGMWVGMWG